MKHYLTIGILLVLSFLLVSCTVSYNPYLHTDYANESWQRSVDTNPDKWERGASSWFLSGGDPNRTEIANMDAGGAANIATDTVHTSPFNNIEVNGLFQVQIYGAEHDAVYLYGPNDAIRQISVRAYNGTLFVHQVQQSQGLQSQMQPPPISPYAMKRVIVRIAVSNLNRLIQNGPGSIEALQIHSGGLSIVSRGCGDIYLTGDANIHKVTVLGRGSVTLLNVHSNGLDINSCGWGAINICGDILIRTLIHQVCGDVNIIGGRSSNLNLSVGGMGKIGICGHLGLRSIVARDKVHVYLYQVTNTRIDIHEIDEAEVGLAGAANELYVTTTNNAIFYGRDLCVNEAYLDASNRTHMNITANAKVFASARDNSSIFFFGPANLVSSYARNHAVIISLEQNNWCNYRSEYRPYSYTLASPTETITVARFVHRRMDYKAEA